MMAEADRYAITVKRVTVDDEDLWRATVRELPDVAEFASSREEAVELAMDTINLLQEIAVEEGRAFPQPIEEEDEYSGRVTLRLPKHLHRAIAEKAAADDMSLNSYIVTVLGMDLMQRVSAASRTKLVAAPIFASALSQKYVEFAANLVRARVGGVGGVGGAAGTASISGSATIVMGTRGTLSFGTAMQGIVEVMGESVPYQQGMLRSAQATAGAAIADTISWPLRRTG